MSEAISAPLYWFLKFFRLFTPGIRIKARKLLTVIQRHLLSQLLHPWLLSSHGVYTTLQMQHCIIVLMLQLEAQGRMPDILRACLMLSELILSSSNFLHDHYFPRLAWTKLTLNPKKCEFKFDELCQESPELLRRWNHDLINRVLLKRLWLCEAEIEMSPWCYRRQLGRGRIDDDRVHRECISPNAAPNIIYYKALKLPTEKEKMALNLHPDGSFGLERKK